MSPGLLRLVVTRLEQASVRVCEVLVPSQGLARAEAVGRAGGAPSGGRRLDVAELVVEGGAKGAAEANSGLAHEEETRPSAQGD